MAGLVGRVRGSDVDAEAVTDREDQAPVPRLVDDHVIHRQPLSGKHHVHALGEVQQGQRLRVLQASHRLHPGARGVDHAARAHAHSAPAQATGGLDTGGAATLANDRVHRGVVQHRCAEASRGAEVGQHEVGVVGEVLAIDAGVGVDGAIQRRLLARHLLGVPVAVDVLALDGAELLVGCDPRAHLQHARPGADGHHHPASLGQVRRDAEDLLALEGGLAHESDVAHCEVAKAAVDQLRGATRGAGGEVLRLEQGHREPALRGVPRDPGAGDAAPDHDAIEALALETIEHGLPRRGGKRRLRHHRLNR